MNELPENNILTEIDVKRRSRLIEFIIELKEKDCISEITEMISSGWNPIDLLDCCMQGMHEIGKRFEEGRYFIAALIMAGEIMRQATKLLEPYLPRQQSESTVRTILLGTIASDIHDLGKNLFAILARSNGFKVVDLGVDVPPARFLHEAHRIKPDLIGISCLLTIALPEVKEAVKLLHVELPQSPVIIGGTCMDEQICRHVQANYWVRDAIQGLQTCQQILQIKHHEA